MNLLLNATDFPDNAKGGKHAAIHVQELADLIQKQGSALDTHKMERYAYKGKPITATENMIQSLIMSEIDILQPMLEEFNNRGEGFAKNFTDAPKLAFKTTYVHEGDAAPSQKNPTAIDQGIDTYEKTSFAKGDLIRFEVIDISNAIEPKPLTDFRIPPHQIDPEKATTLLLESQQAGSEVSSDTRAHDDIRVDAKIKSFDHSWQQEAFGKGSKRDVRNKVFVQEKQIVKEQFESIEAKQVEELLGSLKEGELKTHRSDFDVQKFIRQTSPTYESPESEQAIIERVSRLPDKMWEPYIPKQPEIPDIVPSADKLAEMKEREAEKNAKKATKRKAQYEGKEAAKRTFEGNMQDAYEDYALTHDTKRTGTDIKDKDTFAKALQLNEQYGHTSDRYGDSLKNATSLAQEAKQTTMDRINGVDVKEIPADSMIYDTAQVVSTGQERL